MNQIMDFEQLFADDNAASSVIGVVLLVAITVILAAVVGSFALGLGNQVEETTQTTPQASFGFDQDTVTYGGVEAETVSITHDSGDPISASDLRITVAGNPAFDVNSSNTTVGLWTGNSDVTAGDSVRVVGYFEGSGSYTGKDVDWETDGTLDDANYTEIESGDTIRVVYDSPDSDTTVTLAKHEVQ